MDSICQHNNSYDLCGELMTGRINVKIKIIGTISAHQIQTGMIKGFHVPTDCMKLVLSICRMSWSKDVRNVDPQKWAPTNSDDSILLHVYCKSGYLCVGEICGKLETT